MKVEIIRFHLLSSLYFAPEKDPDPFGYREGSGEKLFCFDLDESQCRSIEPDKTKLLGNLVFGGEAAGAVRKETTGTGTLCLELPRGNYLFAQKREILSREDIINLAAEIQSEGLWQRLKPGKRLYLRYLFEDGREVTQLFRPYAED